MAVKKKAYSEKYAKWAGRISSMNVFMKNVSERKGWKRLKMFYLNDYASALKLKSNIEIVRINMVKDYVRTAVSELYARNPKFKCQPLTQDSFIGSRVTEQAINYYWYIKKVKRQTRKTLKESKLVGYSWIKIGYEGQFGSYEDGGEIHEYIKKDDIFAVYVPHHNVWYDPLAQDPPHDCRWFIHHYLKPTEYLREKYKTPGIKATSFVKFTDKKDNPLAPSDTEMTRVFEIWDKEEEELLLCCDGWTDFLEEKDWQYRHADGTLLVPFYMLDFEPETDMDKEDNIPEPEIESFIDQILEKIKFRSIQVTHIKRFNRQLVYDGDKIKDREMQKFKNGLDGAYLKASGDPNSAVAPIQYPPAQPDMYAIENRIDQDYDRVSGRPGFRSGVSTQTKSRTLGELDKMEESVIGRIAEEQDIVEEFTEAVAGGLVALMRQYFDEERLARIISDVTPLDKYIFKGMDYLDGAAVKYSRKNMASEYDIEIVKGSMLPLNTTQRINYILSVMRFGPAVGLGPQSITSMYLGQALMKEFELKDVEQAYNLDIQNALKPKELSPAEKLKLLKEKQAVDLGATEKRLKESRIEANSLSNLNKAIKNADAMKGKKEGGNKPE